VLGKLSDVTAERREEEARQSQAEYQALVTAAVHHPEHFEIARAEVGAFAERLRGDVATVDAATRQQLLVSVHTVKATTRAYEMTTTTGRLHELEAALAVGDVSVRPRVVQVVLGLDAQFDQVGRILAGREGAETARVERRGLGALADEVAKLDGGARLARGLRALLLQPLASELSGLESVVGGTASDRGKVVRLEVNVGSLRVDRDRLRSLLAAMPHLARNAVAHGIEEPDARLDAGKHPEGCVRLGAELDASQSHLRLWLEDDGAGVDCQRLSESLAARGHAVELESDADVLAALCLPEVSTAAQADAHAGRGVGMSAVAAEVEMLGGRLSLQTSRGKGTRFTIELPVDEADPIAVSEFLAVSDAA
jgi:chemotaxis protein histidine kinase CheA